MIDDADPQPGEELPPPVPPPAPPSSVEDAAPEAAPTEPEETGMVSPFIQCPICKTYFVPNQHGANATDCGMHEKGAA